MTINKYQPLNGQNYKMQMGIKPLDLKNWLEIDENFAVECQKKQKIIEQHHDLCLQADKSIYTAILECQEEILKNLVLYHYKPAKTTLSNEPLAALKDISRLIQEDVCFLSGDPAILKGGLVCFPSRWNLKQKLGMDMFNIHKPVPNFNQKIGATAAKFVAMLPEDKPVWRLNWTLHDSPELFCPYPDQKHKKLDMNNVLNETFLRIERQTLRRLKNSNVVCFTIKTYIRPLNKLLLTKLQKEQALATLKSLPDETMVYKGMKSFYPALIKALEK